MTLLVYPLLTRGKSVVQDLLHQNSCRNMFRSGIRDTNQIVAIVMIVAKGLLELRWLTDRTMRDPYTAHLNFGFHPTP